MIDSRENVNQTFGVDFETVELNLIGLHCKNTLGVQSIYEGQTYQKIIGKRLQ